MRANDQHKRAGDGCVGNGPHETISRANRVLPMCQKARLTRSRNAEKIPLAMGWNKSVQRFCCNSRRFPEDLKMIRLAQEAILCRKAAPGDVKTGESSPAAQNR